MFFFRLNEAAALTSFFAHISCCQVLGQVPSKALSTLRSSISFCSHGNCVRMHPILQRKKLRLGKVKALLHSSCHIVTQSCPTLCHPVNCSPPASSVHGILQARLLQRACPPPGNLPDPGIEPASLVSLAVQVDSLPAEHEGSPGTNADSNTGLVPSRDP